MNISAFFDSLDIGMANALFALAVAIASFALIHTALLFFRKQLCNFSGARSHSMLAEVLKETLARTSSLAVIATSLLLGLSVLDLPEPWPARVNHLWFVTLGAQLALYANHAVAVGARRYFQRSTALAQGPVSVAHTLMVWLIQAGLWVVFLLAMLANLGINVTTFIASLGIGGIAIALAVQNILGDLFASLAIAVDKPFEVGDAISVAGFSGTVEQVGLKTTRVRSDGGEQIVISNTEMLKNTVRNFKRMSTRRVQFPLRVHPETAPTLVAQVPTVLREIIEKQDKIRFDRAHLKTIDQNWLEYEVVYFVLDPSYTLHMDTQQAIMLATLHALNDLGISIGAISQTAPVLPSSAYNRSTAEPSGRGRPQVTPAIANLQRQS